MTAFCRDLKRGNSGDDVRGHKRAISRWNPEIYPWIPPEDGGFSRYFGGKFEAAIKQFQRNKRLTVTGRINDNTHETMEKTKNAHGEPIFDATANNICLDFCRDYREQKMRNEIISAGWYWYENRWNIAYSQARPFQLLRPPRVPDRWDCSAFVTNCYYAGGAPDPNGRDYDQQGYTGTLMNFGKRVSIDDARIGDLIFYGFTTRPSPAFPRGAPTHVAVYVGSVKDIRSVLSHGSFPMKLLPWNYRQVNHVRSYL